MPIGGATAPEEGGKGSELGEFKVSAGSSSSPSKPSTPPLRMHLLLLALYMQGRSHLGDEGLGGEREQSAEASDAIPKKRAKQSIKATISFARLYNP